LWYYLFFYSDSQPPGSIVISQIGSSQVGATPSQIGSQLPGSIVSSQIGLSQVGATPSQIGSQPPAALSARRLVLNPLRSAPSHQEAWSVRRLVQSLHATWSVNMAEAEDLAV